MGSDPAKNLRFSAVFVIERLRWSPGLSAQGDTAMRYPDIKEELR
jgi:hypothetical protein